MDTNRDDTYKIQIFSVEVSEKNKTRVLFLSTLKLEIQRTKGTTKAGLLRTEPLIIS